jgi:excisionase family DNA binding protein
MQAKTRSNKPPTIAPRWLTFQTASPYAGVSEQTLRNWAKAGHIRLVNVTPMGGRGRVLIDRLELDAFIEGYIGSPPSEIVMNSTRRARA